MPLPNCELKGIDHVVIRVHELEPMVAFYCNILGCSLIRKNEEIGLYHLAAGTSMIDLVPVDMKLGRTGGRPPDQEGHNVDHIAIKVDPFNGMRIREYLLAMGLKPGEIETRFGAGGWGPSIYIKDPEGNGIELKGAPKIS